MPPRKPLGERHPCGKLKKAQQDDVISTAVWQRIKADGHRLGTDPRLGSQLGRLGMIGDLTAAQVTAGFRVAGIYREFERHHGRRRNVQSPVYEPSSGGRSTNGETDQDRAVKADRAYLALQDQLSSFSIRVCDAFERLCVDDLAVPSWLLGDVKILLDRLALKWGVSPARSRSSRRR